MPAATRRSTSTSRWLSPAGRSGVVRGDVAQVAEVERRAELLERARGRRRTRPRRRRGRRPADTPRPGASVPSPPRGGRRAPASVRRLRAASRTPIGRSDASWTRPRVDSAAAISAGLAKSDAMDSSSSSGGRRAGEVAGRDRDLGAAREGAGREPRRSQVISSSARVMIATAASTFPCASRRSASPDCGWPLSCSARRNASSAPSRSPIRRRISPISA